MIVLKFKIDLLINIFLINAIHQVDLTNKKIKKLTTHSVICYEVTYFYNLSCCFSSNDSSNKHFGSCVAKELYIKSLKLKLNVANQYHY